MKKVLFSFIVWSTFTGICVTIIALSSLFIYLSPSLPDVETLKDIEFQTPLRIFSADGKLIGEFGEKRREPIDFNDAPQPLINAILSAEDDRFYSHQGVDIKSLLRAASELVITGSIQSGGSTITMQVARNFFLSRNQTFSRKLNEILLALKIENELSKKEILALYLNKIYLGKRAYGFKAAAKVYYGTELDQLSLAQTAMIAGLPKAPSTFNPIVNPTRALIRRNWILRRMHSLGKITKKEYEQATQEPVTAKFHTQQLELNAPYVAEIAREQAITLFGESAYTRGYNVVTTVDSHLQAAGQKAVINGLLVYSQRHGYRGPEATLSIDSLNLLPTPTTATPAINQTITLEEAQLGEVNLLPWIKQLKNIPNYGGLQAAAVIAIQEKSFTALLASGKSVTVTWENGLSTAGRYVNENFHSPAPHKAEAIVTLGDVVRVYQKPIKGEETWHLSQIPKIQGALVALNPKNGSIQTIVGGFDFKQSSFNRVTQAKRLPGSNFKPFIYSIGLENGFTAASVFNDAPIVIENNGLENVWRPENSNGKFFGLTRLRKALYLSRNIVSIRLLRSIGIEKVIAGMERFGMDSAHLPKELSIALGTHAMTPLEIATGYTVFANNGYKVKPFLVDHITNSQGEVIFTETPLTVMPNAPQENPEISQAVVSSMKSDQTPLTPITLKKIRPHNKQKPAPQIMDERVVFIMNSILRDVVTRGTAKRAKQLNRQDIGGKTGTTNGPTDAWFSGFNHHIVATSWVGFDNNAKIGKREYGGTAALPIWIDFMKVALENVPEQLPKQPDGIVTVRINPETGELTTPGNPNGIHEMFLKETVPTGIADNTHIHKEEDKVAPEDIF